MKHLVLQWQTFVFRCCYFNTCEMTSHLINMGVWSLSLHVCSLKAPLWMGIFLFSPFVCWHLEVFRTICVHSLYYRVINTLPDILLQIFFLDYFYFSYLVLSCKAFVLLYFWICLCVCVCVCTCDLYFLLPAWNLRSYHSLQRTDKYFLLIFLVCFHLISLLDSLICLEFIFWSVC